MGGSTSARQANREMCAYLYVRSVSFMAKMERFLYFCVININFHLSLPNFSILVVFSFVFYFFIDFLSQKGPKMLNFDLFTPKNGHQMKFV